MILNETCKVYANPDLLILQKIENHSGYLNFVSWSNINEQVEATTKFE